MLKVLFRLVKYRSIILGDIKISSKAFIRYSVIKGEVNIKTGANVFRANLIGKITVDEDSAIVGPYTYLHTVDKEVSIGKRCAIAPHTTIITSGHNRHLKPKSFSSGGEKTEEAIIIGDDVWLGAGTIVVGGCRLENNVSVGAGAVLLGKTYGPDKFYSGVPAIEK